MALQTGGEIGPYCIEERTGVGGMATVYRARQSRLERDVAVKVLHPAFSAEPNFLARFEREARIVARLDHPHIVPVYDYDHLEEHYFLVLKFVNGVTLRDILQGERLSDSNVLAVMQPIADALDYAHEQGVLHRDIKPSNILIDQRGTPYLTDFGLARMIRPGESTISMETMLGTPHYIAPEQAVGNTNLDARTDVYALGVVLYEMLTGRVPFSGESSFSVVHDHIYTPPPSPRTFNPDISPDVEAVLFKALAKDPADRYQSASAMIEAYAQASGQQMTSPAVLAHIPRQAQSPEPVPAPVVPHIESAATSIQEEIEREVDNARQEVRRAVGEWRAANSQTRWMWKPGAEWTTTPDGTQGFFTQAEIREMEAQLSPDEQIRRRVEKRIEARNEYRTAMVVLSLVLVMLWTIWLLTPGTFPWPIFPSFGIGIAIVAASMDYYNKHGDGARRREELIQREIARERARERERLYGEQKLKNEDVIGHSVRLTGDGELTESFIEDLSDKPRRNDWH
ncbi:MAG: protein kinase domain-containing protein [Phototrophicaceae bacterium]